MGAMLLAAGSVAAEIGLTDSQAFTAAVVLFGLAAFVDLALFKSIRGAKEVGRDIDIGRLMLLAGVSTLLLFAAVILLFV